MKKRPKRDAQKTQQKLLETAEKFFVEKGFDGARVDAIALEAGVNKRMIYVCFGNKELLYLEVLRNAFKRFFKSNMPIPSPANDPMADTEALIRWYFWFLADNPNYVRLFGWESLSDGRRGGKVLLDLMEDGLRELQDVLRRGREQGKFKEDIAAHKVVTMINEMCLGYFSRLKLYEVLWRKDLTDREASEIMLTQIVNLVLGGIVAK